MEKEKNPIHRTVLHGLVVIGIGVYFILGCVIAQIVISIK